MVSFTQQLSQLLCARTSDRSLFSTFYPTNNTNLAQLGMANGLNGQFLSQLPQFQQNVTGFNQFNQLSSTNFQQLATAATGAFQTSNTPQQTANDMMMTGVAGQNIQFAPQQSPINVSVAQTIPSSPQLIAVQSQQPHLIPTTIPTPEPMRQPTPVTLIPQVPLKYPNDSNRMDSNPQWSNDIQYPIQNTTVIVPDPTKNQMLPHPIIQSQASTIPPTDIATIAKLSASSAPLSTAATLCSVAAKPAKKTKRSKAKKEPPTTQTSNATAPLGTQTSVATAVSWTFD